MGRINSYQAIQLLAGRTKFDLGPYRILDYIEQGGMGQVFKAEHRIMGRIVAIKVLPRVKATPSAIASFNNEMRTQAKLDHKNLVRAYDAGHDGMVQYLATEYVPGMDLRHYVRKKEAPLGMTEAATIISQAAEGLQHAHQLGLVHRDVKPGNILVTEDGQTKLADLGLAGWMTGEGDQVHAGKIVGTADYLPPEQIKNPGSVAPVSDIYSLGCTLYYAVTGRVPYPGGTAGEKAKHHCADHLPLHPRHRNRSLSAEFIEVMSDMLQKDPKNRIQTAAEVVWRLAPWTVQSVPAPDELDQTAGVPPRPNAANPPSADELADTADNFVQPVQSLLGNDAPSQTSQWTEPVASAKQETLPGVSTVRARQTGKAGEALENSANEIAPEDAEPRSRWMIVLAAVGLAAAVVLLVWQLLH